MSPTSYQAAPPRNTTIAEQQSPVKSARGANPPPGRTDSHQLLYGVPSIDEGNDELECTSTIPLFV